jgi:transposase
MNVIVSDLPTHVSASRNSHAVDAGLEAQRRVRACRPPCGRLRAPLRAERESAWFSTARHLPGGRALACERRFPHFSTQDAERSCEETGKAIAQVARDLGVDEGTLGNWVDRARAEREAGRRRGEGGVHQGAGLHGSPRLHADLREAGWVVSEKVVADSMTCCAVISPLSGPTPDGWAT